MLAINFTDEAVYMATGENRQSALVIDKCAKVSLNEGVIKNGMIADYETLKSVLNQALFANEIKQSQAVITVMSTVISNTEFVIPYSQKQKEMDAMIYAESSQLLAGGEYISDYTTSEPFTEEDGKKCRANVYIVPRTMVEEYKKLLTDLGIKKCEFDTDKNCLANLCRMEPEHFDNAVIAYADRKLIEIYLILSSGEIMLRKFPVTMSAVPDGSLAAEVASQLIKIIQYKQISFPGSGVEKVYLITGQNDDALAADIEQSINVPVSKMPKPNNINIVCKTFDSPFVLPVLALRSRRS